MNDSRYKRDALVQAWVDRRDLATIVLGMTKLGMGPKHLSDVMRYTIKETVISVVSKGGTYIELMEDACDVIESCLTVKLNPGGKGLENMRHNAKLDESRLARMGSAVDRSEALHLAEVNVDKVQLLVDSGLAPDREEAEKMIKKHDQPLDKN